MSTASTPVMTPHPALTLQGFFRLSVDDYHDMIRNEILTTEDRVELLDGYLVMKMPQYSAHASTVTRLTKLLVRQVPDDWQVRIQLPVTLSDSEPEPDGAIAKGDSHTFDQRHPIATDLALVIEVSDSSLRLDREVKGPMYARSGVVVYWIINLVDRQIEVSSDPQPTGYATQTIYKTGDAVPLVLDGQAVAAIPVSELVS